MFPGHCPPPLRWRNGDLICYRRCFRNRWPQDRRSRHAGGWRSWIHRIPRIDIDVREGMVDDAELHRRCCLVKTSRRERTRQDGWWCHSWSEGKDWEWVVAITRFKIVFVHFLHLLNLYCCSYLKKNWLIELLSKQESKIVYFGGIREFPMTHGFENTVIVYPNPGGGAPGFSIGTENSSPGWVIPKTCL